MGIPPLISHGFGNGTYDGSIALVVTYGYTPFVAAPEEVPVPGRPFAPGHIFAPADLQFLRDCAALALPDTCDIQTSQNQQDGSGGYAEVWSTSYQNVACRISPSGTNGSIAVTERMIANRRSGVTDWLLTLPFDQPITEAMRFIYLGRTYEVIFVHRPQSFDTVRRCLVRRF